MFYQDNRQLMEQSMQITSEYIGLLFDKINAHANNESLYRGFTSKDMK